MFYRSYFYGSQVWHADITLMMKLDRFQARCFRWIFVHIFSYVELLRRIRFYPSFQLQLLDLTFFIQPLKRKYDADAWKYIKVSPIMANIRSSSNNPFQLKHHTKTNYNTHFERVIIPANFLQRHGVILCKISVYVICRYLIRKLESFSDNSCSFYTYIDVIPAELYKKCMLMNISKENN